MAGEFQFTGTSGLTHRVVLRNAAGQVWRVDTAAFGTWSDAQIANYAIPATEQGTSGYFAGNMPAGVATAQILNYVAYQIAGASLALTDQPPVATGGGEWDGSAWIVPQGAVTVDGKTLPEFLRLIGAVLLGRLSGAGTGTEVFRALDNSQDRVTSAVTPEGNRILVTLDSTE